MSAELDRLRCRMTKVEQELADLRKLIDHYGMPLLKCDFCHKVLTKYVYVIGPQLLGVNGVGIHAISLRDGKYSRYYCIDHLPEALQDCADWSERDKERAQYTIAAWLLRHTIRSTPDRTKMLALFPDIREKIELLKELPEEERGWDKRREYERHF